jgi:hypothetical protein
MGDINLRTSDPLNYQLPGSVQLLFRKRGSTAAADWKDLGNLVSASISPTLQTLEHFSMRRGQRAKDRVVISERSAQLNFSIDEINRDNLQFAFGSTADPENSDVDTRDNKQVTNPGGVAPNNTVDLKREDIEVGSVIVRRPELDEDPTPFITGVDYTVDEPSGIITILPGGALNDNSETGTPRLHVTWTESHSSQAFSIFPGTEIDGEGQFQVLTPGGIKYVAVFPKVTIKNNGEINMGDGSTWQEIALTMDILVDDEGVLGTLHVLDEDI